MPHKEIGRAWLVQGCLYILVPALLFALWLWLAQVPFHEDEAIYAVWARGVAQRDWALWQIPVDKPPLTLYPIAALIALGARAEWLIRLPSLLWGLLALWGIGQMAAQQGRSAGVARLLALASPLWWTLWASAFTDMAGMALAVAAAAVVQLSTLAPTLRYRAGGLLMALALLAKPTMLFLLPVALAWLYADSRQPENMGITNALQQWLAAFSAVVLVAWAWDASRVAPSWWRLGAEAYGTLGQSGAAWGQWGWLGVGALGMQIGYWVLSIEKRQFPQILERVEPLSFPNTQYSILITILLWIPLHILLGFQPWERYLLPLVAVVAVAAAPKVRIEETEGQRSPFALLPRLVLLLSLCAAPLLVTPWRYAPHDGRWRGLPDMGQAVAALPHPAEVWYGVAGRPLAWYAADAQVPLYWAGREWADFPGCAAGRYVVARYDEPIPAATVQVASAGDFTLRHCPNAESR